MQNSEQSSKLIVEYINECELGPNYRENYIVYHDDATNEDYIIDYSQKYKYVIRESSKQQQQQSTVVDVDTATTDSDDTSALLSTHPSQREQRFIYGYVDESELNLIDLSKLTILKNDLLDEYYIKDPVKSSRFWIILQKNWNENENSTYIAETDVDLMNWIVSLEQNTNRKYIIDDRDSTKYYIIPHDYMKEFKENWYKYYKSYRKTATASERPVSVNRDMIIEYVDEDELKTINLLNVKIQKDKSYNEYYIQDPTNINRRWIVLQSNWFKNQAAAANSQHYYIFDDEVNNKQNVIYKDAQKRRFIVDKKTDMKLYLVPRVIDHKQSFKYKWSQIDQSLTKPPQSAAAAAAKAVNTKLSQSKVVQTSSSTTTTPKPSIEIIELPRSPRPLHYLMIDQSRRKEDKEKGRTASTSITTIRQRSASNEVIERRLKGAAVPAVPAVATPTSPQLNRQRLLEAQIYGHSSNNLVTEAEEQQQQQQRSYSGRVKKTVYFNENVAISDGQTKGHKIAPLASPMSYEPPTPMPSLPRTAAPPPVKPREIKPMSEFITNNQQPPPPPPPSMKPFSYTNPQAQQQPPQQQIIRIKPQHGRPGHLIHTTTTNRTQ